MYEHNTTTPYRLQKEEENQNLDLKKRQTQKPSHFIEGIFQNKQTHISKRKPFTVTFSAPIPSLLTLVRAKKKLKTSLCYFASLSLFFLSRFYFNFFSSFSLQAKLCCNSCPFTKGIILSLNFV